MNALLILIQALSWISTEPYTYVYFSREPRPEWCNHPSMCGDWPVARILVVGDTHLDVSHLLPGVYYISVTSSYDRNIESEFSRSYTLRVSGEKE